MGTSGPSTSIRQLSTPSPVNAANTCSTVATRAGRSPETPRVVERTVATTLAARAGTSVPRSWRTKVMPESGGAGASVTVAGRPEWRPTPVQLALFFKVRWLKYAIESWGRPSDAVSYSIPAGAERTLRALLG